MIKRLADSHIHFWNPDQLRYEWLSELPAINRPYTPAELVQAVGDAPVQKIVFVQADCIAADGLNEVAWVSELAEADLSIQGIVAFAPLEEDKIAVYLTKLGRYPLVKGVRRLIQGESLSFVANPDFVRGVQQLADFNYTFDICVRHEQLPAVIGLVRQCPTVRFVLDHLGKPAVKMQLLEPWATDLRRLADLPNVWCKLSGLVTEADWQTWSAADLQPYIEQALVAFGPDRLMFGGDWPVSELASEYGRWLQTAETAVRHLTESERDGIFYTNAVDFYGL